MSPAGRIINLYFTRDRRSVASSWCRVTVNTSDHAWESVRRSHDSRYENRLLLQEVYPISRHLRAKPNEVAIKTRARERGYYRTNYGAGSIHLRTKSMTNQSLTANGNEPALRINLKRVGQANYVVDDDASLHIGRRSSMSACQVCLVREKAKATFFIRARLELKDDPRYKSRWAAFTSWFVK